jgi:DNA-binding CsgD family transcriptional regulator
MNAAKVVREAHGGRVDAVEPLLRSLVEELSANDGLTAREADVVLEALRGRAPKEVAHALGCTESTVYKHWTRILAKTGLPNRECYLAHAITIALTRVTQSRRRILRTL